MYIVNVINILNIINTFRLIPFDAFDSIRPGREGGTHVGPLPPPRGAGQGGGGPGPRPAGVCRGAVYAGASQVTAAGSDLRPRLEAGDNAGGVQGGCAGCCSALWSSSLRGASASV